MHLADETRCATPILVLGPSRRPSAALIARPAQPRIELVLHGPLAPSLASSDNDSRGFSPTPTANNVSVCSSISADGGTVRLTA